MSKRQAHLVGSIPAPTAAEAMAVAMDRLGPLLATLPDGETGERRNWIIHIIEALRAHPDLELVHDGDWSGYDKLPRFKVRRGHRLYGASLDFGHLKAVQESWPDFEKVRADSGRQDLSFLVGIPGDFDLAMFTLGPAGGLRHRSAFTEATLSEIRDIAQLVGRAAVFQIEVPAELVLLSKVPRQGQAAAARVLGRRIAQLAAASPAGTRFGVHLCLGDMNHEALGRMTDSSPLVHLTNGIVRAWPVARPLEYVHAPFAAADEPPPTEAAFYAPLADLELPGWVRFVAGFAHENQPMEDQLAVRELLDAAVGRPVDVSTSCGLGRRDAGAGLAAMERIAALCAD
jgi:hypothetical protein